MQSFGLFDAGHMRSSLGEQKVTDSFSITNSFYKKSVSGVDQIVI